MKHLEVLVEERSTEAVLLNLIPRIVGAVSFKVHPYAGKEDLLTKLPQRLDGYASWMPDDWRILVLLDRDREDCRDLKNRLDDITSQRSFVIPKGASARRAVNLVNRLAIEELEAWFLGDAEALHAAYPRVSTNLHQRRAYRDPDAISGGTWEALERVLKRAGYYPSGLPKIEVARRISMHMEPDRNRSRSFRVFCDGLRKLATG